MNRYELIWQNPAYANDYLSYDSFNASATPAANGRMSVVAADRFSVRPLTEQGTYLLLEFFVNDEVIATYTQLPCGIRKINTETNNV